jgi:hypothetical protein
MLGLSKKKLALLLVIVTVLVFLLLGLIIFVLSLGRPDASQSERKPASASSSNSKAAKSKLKGVSISPKSTGSADFLNFFERASQTVDLIDWTGDWLELTNEKSAAFLIEELSGRYGYEPLAIAGTYNQGEKKPIRPHNATNRKIYQDSAVAYVEKYKPAYIGFGVEINIMYENHPAEFEEFVKLFNDTAKAIKEKSPDTKVFTVFQLERLKGLRGGLFGGVNNTSNHHWSLIDRFTQADVVGFTTYPGLIYKDPSEIPPDYYSEIKNHTSKPLVFTEIGWHSVASPKGWESSDAEQASFVDRFFALSNGLNIKIFVWPFLYDPPHNIELFRTMGLISNSGVERPAFQSWVNAKVD